MNLVDVFRLASNAPEQQNAVLELARRNIKTVQDVADGVSETAALMITASAAEVVSGFAGIGAGAVTGDGEKAANAVKVVQELMTYQPKTEGGQKAMQALGESIVGQFGEILTEASQKTGDFAYNKTGSEALAALAYSVPTLALEAGVLKPFTKAGKAAVKAGMHTPRIFAGALSKTADLKKMDAAKELAKRGVSRDEIWQKTGWFNDVDGNWKFEIDDSRAKYMQPDTMSPTASKYSDLQQRLYSDLNMSEKDAIGWMEFEGIEGVSPADYKAQVIAQTRSELADIKSGSYPLMGQVLGHDDIRKAYPDTDIMRVKYQGESMRDFAGEASYLEADDMLTLTENSPLSKSAALHEVQHGIQGREGFAKGGNVDTTGGSWDDIMREAERAYNEANGLDGGISNADILADLYDTPKAAAKAKPFNELTKLAKAQWAEDGKMRLYKRLAGEAEARNVQTRMDYTPEQRAANPPWTTLDVPEGELIVR